MDGSDGAVGDACEVEREAKVELRDRPKDTPFLLNSLLLEVVYRVENTARS